MFERYTPRSSESLFSRHPSIIAHRGGAREAPENTLAAFGKAAGCGYAVECDVRMSKDGRLVVFHDDTLGRTTNGQGRIADKNLDELKILDTGDGEKIPTLVEMLELIGGRVPIIVEVKCQSRGSAAMQLARVFVGDIRAMNAMDYVVVASFNPFILYYVRSILPKLLRGLIFSTHSWFALKRLVGKPDLLMPDYHLVDKSFVDDMHEGGYRIFPWTVDDPDDARDLIERGVDGIITNRPSSLLPT